MKELDLKKLEEIITVTAYIQSELEQESFFDSIDENKKIATEFVELVESHNVNWDNTDRCFEKEISLFYIHKKIKG